MTIFSAKHRSMLSMSLCIRSYVFEYFHALLWMFRYDMTKRLLLQNYPAIVVNDRCSVFDRMLLNTPSMYYYESSNKIWQSGYYYEIFQSLSSMSVTLCLIVCSWPLIRCSIVKVKTHRDDYYVFFRPNTGRFDRM